jgi:hypothetical protein
MNYPRLRSTLILSLLAFPAAVGASTWTELGDAGASLATANTVTSANPTAILGEVGSTQDADLYALLLTAGVPFAATSSGAGAVSDIFDTQLFLFDSGGRGLRYNDDIVVTNFYSSIRFTPSLSGRYYLGISAVNFNPLDAGGNFIYLSDPFNPAATPGASSRGALASWAPGPSGLTDSGRYRISVTGASAAAVPEPGTALLVLLGFAGLAAFWRRGRSH